MDGSRGRTTGSRANPSRTLDLWLFAPAFVILLPVWFCAPFVGRALGSMVVAYFALGAVLATINVFELAIAWVVKRDMVRQGGETSRWAPTSSPRSLLSAF